MQILILNTEYSSASTVTRTFLTKRSYAPTTRGRSTRFAHDGKAGDMKMNTTAKNAQYPLLKISLAGIK
ncbi:TPA: hypothetical protein SMS82_000502 [Pseudomonas aeruginosa]|nr:hypothetical protein [Pseudomonas aeruginosa]HEK2322821.1 hypothetical protein [Pseudomonas aeruginosa]